MQTLNNNKAKEAWSWLKKVTNMKNEGQMDGPLIDKNTGLMVTNEEEIRERLKMLRDGRAASLDRILCGLDKHGKSNLSKIILKLFNMCLNSGFIPKEWKKNTVVMVYKKGDKKDLYNYRGITLINTLSKIYCKILANRISKTKEETKIIRKKQTGFIEGGIGLNTVGTAIEIIERRNV